MNYYVAFTNPLDLLWNRIVKHLCLVKKHVNGASSNLNLVITTYDGKHMMFMHPVRPSTLTNEIEIPMDPIDQLDLELEDWWKSMLLDSPTSSNSPVLPSPNNEFMPTENNKNGTPSLDDCGVENTYPDYNTLSVGFNDINSLSNSNVVDQVNSHSRFHPEIYTDTSQVSSQINSTIQHGEFSEPHNMNGGISSEQTRNACGVTELSPPLDQPSVTELSPPLDQPSVTELSPPLDQPSKDGVHQRNKYPNSHGDGYYWRKYGTKVLKSSEYPRTYFKCTQKDCPAKKKSEQTNEGVVEIINGPHNHPQPQSSIRGKRPLHSPQPHGSLNGDLVRSSMNINNRDPMSLVPDMQAPNYTSYKLLDDSLNDVDVAEEERVLYKKGRSETYTPEMGASRVTEEPKIVFRTKSEVDVLDDGYRWRKYGQKVGKGNPNPRSYYKCMTGDCSVRKHIERASNDPSYVLTTYVGKHKHGVPTTRVEYSLGVSSSFQVCESSETMGGISHQLGSSGVQGTDTPSSSNFNHGMNYHGTADDPGATGM